jgi:hypothetical protein
MYPLIWNREEKEAKGPTLHRVSCVSSVVLLGRDTGLPRLLAPDLLTGVKGVDLVIRGNVVLNTLSAYSNSMLLRDQICINSSSIRQVSGLAELSYARGFDSPLHNRTVWFVSTIHSWGSRLDERSVSPAPHSPACPVGDLIVAPPSPVGIDSDSPHRWRSRPRHARSVRVRPLMVGGGTSGRLP